MNARQIVRAVVKAFKAELGAQRKTNPWPKCRVCFRRVDPLLMCAACGACDGPCCNKCGTCGRCTRACNGHKEEDQ